MMLHHITTRSIVLLAAFAALAAGACAQDKTTELAIVANKSLKLDTATTAELQRYFKAEKTKAPDGTKLVIFMFDAGRPERAAALSGIYKMTEAQYADFVVEATFTGAMSAAPKSLPSPDAVKKFVAETPGALCYLRASEADDSVKIVKVDGVAPGEAGYKLKL